MTNNRIFLLQQIIKLRDDFITLKYKKYIAERKSHVFLTIKQYMIKLKEDLQINQEITKKQEDNEKKIDEIEYLTGLMIKGYKQSEILENILSAAMENTNQQIDQLNEELNNAKNINQGLDIHHRIQETKNNNKKETSLITTQKQQADHIWQSARRSIFFNIVKLLLQNFKEIKKDNEVNENEKNTPKQEITNKKVNENEIKTRTEEIINLMEKISNNINDNIGDALRHKSEVSLGTEIYTENTEREKILYFQVGEDWIKFYFERTTNHNSLFQIKSSIFEAPGVYKLKIDDAKITEKNTPTQREIIEEVLRVISVNPVIKNF